MDVGKVDEDAEDELDKPGTTIGTKFSILQMNRIPSLEMWFFTMDPFVGTSVFIAKLSKRQYCWVFSRTFIHSQEYIQFFDIHNCLFMRFALLHWRL